MHAARLRPDEPALAACRTDHPVVPAVHLVRVRRQRRFVLEFELTDRCGYESSFAYSSGDA